MNKILLIMLLGVTVAVGSVYVRQTPSKVPDSPENETIDAVSTNSGLLQKVVPEDLPVVTQEVKYFNEVEGFLAKPLDKDEFPGVVMIHEWWGLNDNIRDTAQQLAAFGYTVLAVDLYNGQVTAEAAQARELVSGLDQQAALQNLRGAVAYLRSVGSTKIGSLGWCFGGGQSLQLALSGEPLDATVIYYGNLVTNSQQLKVINWPVLGIFGDEDQTIPVAEVRQFEHALDQAEVVNEIHVFEGVGHAFANPTGQAYAPDETEAAWDRTLDFLGENLQGL